MPLHCAGAILLLPLFFLPRPQDKPVGLSFPEGDSSAEVTARELEAWVRWLAADALEGRATGSDGSRAAAEGIAEGLRAAGVSPGGDGESFQQDVALWSVTTAPIEALELLAPGDAVLPAPEPGTFEVLSGEGARGSLGVQVIRTAADLPARPDAGIALYMDGSRSRALRWLKAMGAPGGLGFGLIVHKGRASVRPPRSARTSIRSDPPASGLPPSVRVHGPLRGRFAAGEVASIALSLGRSVTRLAASNVVGVLAGVGTKEHPELAQEVIVVSAHYDHLGLKRGAGEEGDDQIYNGADDDASGVAGVIELAGKLSAGTPPARTLVFLLVTGEERGLLGTHYYLDHPALPLEKTVYNLNLEMIGRPDPILEAPGAAWLTGWERTNVGERALELGVLLDPDRRPEQRFFERSDNYAFALRGIPAQTVSSYGMHEDYHTVRDEADTLDYVHLEGAARRAADLLVALASGAINPRWNPGQQP